MLSRLLPSAADKWKQRIKNRFFILVRKRMRPAAAVQELSSRSTYIVPTGYGIFFAIVLYAMLMGSLNYSNSMGLMLTFLLVGIALVGMVYTYNNLTKLRLVAGHAKAVFVGDNAEFPVFLQTSNERPVFRIAAGPNRKDLHTVDIAANGTSKININVLAKNRGWLELDPIRVQSTFPLGWFRVWAWVAIKSKTLVFPEPVGKRRLPPHEAEGSGRKHSQAKGNDDFAGTRRYQPGDPPAHIAWKALAKGHDVLTKQFSDQSGEELWLNWDRLDGLNTEQRLSQLCLWVLNLHQLGRRYGLNIPGTIIKPDLGEQQRRLCLEALALFE